MSPLTTGSAKFPSERGVRFSGIRPEARKSPRIIPVRGRARAGRIQPMPFRSRGGASPYAICADLARCYPDRPNPPYCRGDVTLNGASRRGAGLTFLRNRFGVMLQALRIGRNMPVGLLVVRGDEAPPELVLT